MTTKDEREHLEALTRAPGWALFDAAVRQQWDEQFSQYVRKAADDREDATALQKLRQVLAAREAVLRVLGWPTERLASLERQATTSTQQTPQLSRRGAL